MLYANLNGCKIKMLYDPGAAYSVISKSVWQRIGAPQLTPTPSLLAYTSVEIKTLGKADIVVQAFKQERTVTVYVVDKHDTPLFGMDWVLAFGIALPKGLHLCAVTSANGTEVTTTT